MEVALGEQPHLCRMRSTLGGDTSST